MHFAPTPFSQNAQQIYFVSSAFKTLNAQQSKGQDAQTAFLAISALMIWIVAMFLTQASPMGSANLASVWNAGRVEIASAPITRNA